MAPWPATSNEHKMFRIARLSWTCMILALCTALASAAEFQTRQRPHDVIIARATTRTLLGPLSFKKVQKELELSEESATELEEFRKTLDAEMQERFIELREVKDRRQRRTKLAELLGEYNQKSLKRLLEVLSPDKTFRLFQIIMQARPVTECLTHVFVAGRLQLTDEQKAKLTLIVTDAQARRSSAFENMRGAIEEQREEALAKCQKIRADADEKAMGILTAEQIRIIEEMKGEKFEFLPNIDRP